MKIGHICLATPTSERGERFAELVEALARHGIEQHVLVAGVALARRLAACPGVSVGPIVKTPVMAYCLMPKVDLAHVHESKSGQAGLLLTLTRSIPFVITSKSEKSQSRNPLTRSVIHRAVGVIPPSDVEAADQTAAEYLSTYENAVNSWTRSAMML